jgi:hypothetical protein
LAGDTVWRTVDDDVAGATKIVGVDHFHDGRQDRLLIDRCKHCACACRAARHGKTYVATVILTALALLTAAKDALKALPEFKSTPRRKQALFNSA